MARVTLHLRERGCGGGGGGVHIGLNMLTENSANGSLDTLCVKIISVLVRAFKLSDPLPMDSSVAIVLGSW